MNKKPLIVISLCAAVLLVLGTMSNVVGYQTVQTSQQNSIKERINQGELLFQGRFMQTSIIAFLLSKVISNSRLFSLLKQNQKKISEVKNKFINIIEKKTKRNRILSALSKSINQHRSLDYPIINFIVNVFIFVLCIILGISSLVSGFLFIFSSIIVYILDPIDNSNVAKFMTMLWAFFGLFWLFVLCASVIGLIEIYGWIFWR